MSPEIRNIYNTATISQGYRSSSSLCWHLLCLL